MQVYKIKDVFKKMLHNIFDKLYNSCILKYIIYFVFFRYAKLQLTISSL